MKNYTIEPVTCKRGKTYDAEIVFKEETYTRGDSTVKYNQRFLQSGFGTQEDAAAHAQVEVDAIRELLTTTVNNYMSKWKEAKP